MSVDDDEMVRHPLVEAVNKFFDVAKKAGLQDKAEIEEFEPFGRRWSFPEISFSTVWTGYQAADIRAKKRPTVFHRAMAVGQTYTVRVEFRRHGDAIEIVVATSLPSTGNLPMNRYYYPPPSRDAEQAAGDLLMHDKLCAIATHLIEMATKAVRKKVAELLAEKSGEKSL